MQMLYSVRQVLFADPALHLCICIVNSRLLVGHPDTWCMQLVIAASASFQQMTGQLTANLAAAAAGELSGMRALAGGGLISLLPVSLAAAQSLVGSCLLTRTYCDCLISACCAPMPRGSDCELSCAICVVSGEEAAPSSADQFLIC